MNNPYILLIPVVIALAAIPVLIYIWYRNRAFLAEALPAKGIVIGLHKSGGKSGPVYSPIVRFTTADNRTVEFTDSTGSRPARFKVGDQVDVLYHRQRIRWARVTSPNSGGELWELLTSSGFTALLVLICLLMAALGYRQFSHTKLENVRRSIAAHRIRPEDTA
jgi:hypothetical protein